MGWLKAVGTGIRICQLTIEAQQAIQTADVVFSIVVDQLAMAELEYHNPNVVDLRRLYGADKERLKTYREMAAEVLVAVREGKKVCFAIYGHPLIFAYPTLLAIETARQEGFDTEFLPGISAADSMFCDLEIDPAAYGCQIYNATALVYENRVFDPHSVLTLWQVGIIGESRMRDERDAECYERLCNMLLSAYGPDHPVIFYEAATSPFCPPNIWKIPLSDLQTANTTLTCTLVVPPVGHPDLVKVSLTSKPATWVSWPSPLSTD